MAPAQNVYKTGFIVCLSIGVYLSGHAVERLVPLTCNSAVARSHRFALVALIALLLLFVATAIAGLDVSFAQVDFFLT